MAGEMTLWRAFEQVVFAGPVEALRAWSEGTFFILTAHNPGGVVRDAAANLRADLLLQAALAGCDRLPAAGCSPDLAHREDGWAVRLESREQALELARRFGQLAWYEVRRGGLFLVDAEGRRPDAALGRFASRLRED